MDEMLPMPAPETTPEPELPEFDLVIWPDESLKYKATFFPEKDLGSPLVRQTADRMVKLMQKYKGVGLAAQQAGIPFQIFVMQSAEGKEPRIFLNPKVTGLGDNFIQLQSPGEGCLSFPYGYRQPVMRLDKLELEWLDFDGQVHHEWFEGHEAIIIQHELDHLAGYCFIDRLSWLKRSMAISKARRIRRQYAKGFKRGLRELKNAPRTPAYNLKRWKSYEEQQRTNSLK